MTPFWHDDWLSVYQGDCRTVMSELPAESVHCVVTSPPYWGLRDYGTAAWEGGDEGCDHRPEFKPRSERPNVTGAGIGKTGYAGQEPAFREVCGKCGARRQDNQLGLEPTPEEYVANMVAVFREVRRVLRNDGTVWLNLGDSYAGGNAMGRAGSKVSGLREVEYGEVYGKHGGDRDRNYGDGPRPDFAGLKPKDLVGIPWRVAFALQADGWFLRSDIIWSKNNPMPESVTDRPTKSHEYLFLLSKSPRYFFDSDAVRENYTAGIEAAKPWAANGGVRNVGGRTDGLTRGTAPEWEPSAAGRNLRSVWTIDYNDTEWTTAIGSCRKCGGLRVAGIGSEPTTSKATDASPASTEPSPASSAPIALPTSSLWDPSDQDSPSTTSAVTEDVSTLPISSQSRSATTSIAETPLPLETPRKPIASTATSSRLRTLIRDLEAAGSAVCVCATDNGAAAPLFDVWEIATQPYPGAHFATFPAKLVEPCIKAGTSERGVCPECGAPWVRLVRSLGPEKPNEHDRRVPSGQSEHQGLRMAQMGSAWIRDTTGWRPSCPHGRCPVGHNTDGARTDGDLSRVWQDLRSEGSPPADDVLLEGVRESGDGEDQGNNQGLRAESEGIHPPVPPESPDGDEDGLRRGASAGDGRGPWADAPANGSGRPHQRDQGRQPTGEPSGPDEEGSRRDVEPGPSADGDVPRLRLPLRAQGSCRQCGADLRPLDPVPGVVLDCFAGSGTTGLVAQALGRRAILIDLSTDYMAQIMRRNAQIPLAQ